MTGDRKPPTKSPMQASRESRLVAALRANLKRRKAAERASDARPAGTAGATGPDAATRPPGRGKE